MLIRIVDIKNLVTQFDFVFKENEHVYLKFKMYFKNIIKDARVYWNEIFQAYDCYSNFYKKNYKNHQDALVHLIYYTLKDKNFMRNRVFKGDYSFESLFDYHFNWAKIQIIYNLKFGMVDSVFKKVYRKHFPQIISTDYELEKLYETRKVFLIKKIKI